MFGGDWTQPVNVKFRPIINQILEVSEVNQKIEIKMWFLHEWNDQRLIWDPKEYGNISVLHIPADKVRARSKNFFEFFFQNFLKRASKMLSLFVKLKFV